MLWGGAVVLLTGLCIALRVAYLHDDMMATRNFYGSLSVKRSISEDGEQRPRRHDREQQGRDEGDEHESGVERAGARVGGRH